MTTVHNKHSPTNSSRTHPTVHQAPLGELLAEVFQGNVRHIKSWLHYTNSRWTHQTLHLVPLGELLAEVFQGHVGNMQLGNETGQTFAQHDNDSACVHRLYRTLCVRHQCVSVKAQKTLSKPSSATTIYHTSGTSQLLLLLKRGQNWVQRPQFTTDQAHRSCYCYWNVPRLNIQRVTQYVCIHTHTCTSTGIVHRVRGFTCATVFNYPAMQTATLCLQQSFWHWL